MRQTFTLCRLFDIPVGVHVSWLLAFALMLVSIARAIGGVTRGAAFEFAAVCALLLFASVIAHELAHALVARRFAVRTRAITLFLFGGVATLEAEPPTPRAEALIALAGPAMSALLAAAAFGLLALLGSLANGAVGVVCAYVALANGVLAVFNLIPAFPMDGGRVVRAAIWQVRKSRAAATGAASLVGIAVATLAIAAGVAGALLMHAWSDVWYVLIGGFVLRLGWLQLRDSRVSERLERLRGSDMRDAPGASRVAPERAA